MGCNQTAISHDPDSDRDLHDDSANNDICIPFEQRLTPPTITSVPSRSFISTSPSENVHKIHVTANRTLSPISHRKLSLSTASPKPHKKTSISMDNMQTSTRKLSTATVSASGSHCRIPLANITVSKPQMSLKQTDYARAIATSNTDKHLDITLQICNDSGCIQPITDHYMANYNDYQSFARTLKKKILNPLPIIKPQNISKTFKIGQMVLYKSNVKAIITNIMEEDLKVEIIYNNNDPILVFAAQISFFVSNPQFSTEQMELIDDQYKCIANVFCRDTKLIIPEPIINMCLFYYCSDQLFGVFQPHMSIEEASKLDVGCRVDHRDKVGRFIASTITAQNGSNCRIHYDGWGQQWDVYSDYSKELHRFAKVGSISKRAAHRFEQMNKGGYIKINPTPIHAGWKIGTIHKFDNASGQVQVAYKYHRQDWLYWTHLDNVYEVKSSIMYSN